MEFLKEILRDFLEKSMEDFFWENPEQNIGQNNAEIPVVPIVSFGEC